VLRKLVSLHHSQTSNKDGFRYRYRLTGQTHHLCYTYCRATGGISYAAPTYYAGKYPSPSRSKDPWKSQTDTLPDRLCDRARLYLPKTWTGSDEPFKASLEAAKTTEQTRLQDQRDQDCRQGRAFDAAAGDVKSNAELDDEKLDPERLRVLGRRLVLAYAKNEFYSAKPPGTTQDGNPWHDDLRNIMFWM
jgi:hypothetical protein